VLAYRYDGVRYDCGAKLGYLQATVEYALRHDEVGPEFAAWLREKAAAKQAALSLVKVGGGGTAA
jgi:UTP--glucose-1-phosphate uridylyltransferase